MRSTATPAVDEEKKTKPTKTYPDEALRNFDPETLIILYEKLLAYSVNPKNKPSYLLSFFIPTSVQSYMGLPTNLPYATKASTIIEKELTLPQLNWLRYLHSQGKSLEPQTKPWDYGYYVVTMNLALRRSVSNAMIQINQILQTMPPESITLDIGILKIGSEVRAALTEAINHYNLKLHNYPKLEECTTHDSNITTPVPKEEKTIIKSSYKSFAP